MNDFVRFLMHRVELKDACFGCSEGFGDREVPNAPCGVERIFFLCCLNIKLAVPNAPCGVESSHILNTFLGFGKCS